MKKNFLKKTILSTVVAVTALSAVGCGTDSSKDAADSSAQSNDANVEQESESTAQSTNEATTITVGANITPHSELLYEAQKILAKEGINLEVVEIEDSTTPNTGVFEGTLDANFFQHVPYLENWDEENGADLVSIGAVHYEPFGVYSKNITSLDELEDGAKIAVPNNTTNEARALLLLEQEGIIKLADGAGIEATINDIVENPKNVSFVEIDPAQLVNALPDVSAAVINGNYALEGGLSVGKDALAVEANDGLAAETYANIIATREANKDNPALLRLVEVLQSDEIKEYIEANYDGAVVPVK